MRPEAREDWRVTRTRSAEPVRSAGSRSPGSGAHSAARGHVLRARGACRGPRKARRAGVRACAPRPPRPHSSPGLRPPGGGSGRRRGPSWVVRGEPGPQVPWWGCFCVAAERCPEPGPLDACLCWRRSVAAPGGKSSSYTGLWGAHGGAPLWNPRRGPLDTADPGTRRREAGPEMGRSRAPGSAPLSSGRPPAQESVAWASCWVWEDWWDSGSFGKPALARSRPPRVGSPRSAALPRGLWLVERPPQFGLLAPSGSLPGLVRPRESARSVRALPSLAYLFMAHTSRFPRRICERRSNSWLETSL